MKNAPATPRPALFVELVFYVLLALGLARSQSIALVWLGVACAYHVAAAVWGWDRYFSIPAAGLAFAAGALTCHVSLRRRPPAQTGTVLWLRVLGLYTLFVAAAMAGKFAFDYGTHGVVLYLNVLVASACVYQLYRVEPESPRLRSIDGFLGDLSYPVYLIHWQVALAVHWLTGMPRGDGLLFAALGPVLLLACFMERVQRRPVAALRRRLLRGPRPSLTAVEVSS